MAPQLSPLIQRVVQQLQSIDSIIAVALGGSRARGNATPTSDIDLGLYYRPEQPPDLLALNRLAAQLDDDHRTNLITPIGEWGNWINGGGWLKVEGIPVDFLYRDLAQVAGVIADCRAGKLTIDYQPGHPHGFVSSIYLGEIALGLPLHDPHGALTTLKAQTTPYPPKLKRATISRFAWEIGFSLFVAQKAVARADIAYAAGCCFRSVACMNQVLFALNEAYLLNEKGAVALANSFALCPPNYQQRVESAFVLAEAQSIADAVTILAELERDLRQWYGDAPLVELG